MSPRPAIFERYDEVKKLYDLSESDIICMTQMATLLVALGYSPKLLVKLLRALTTMWEMSVEEMEKSK